MSNFEMIIKDVFYLTDGRMVFSGKFVINNGIHLPTDAIVYVNGKSVGKIQLTTLPFSSGKAVRKDIDTIEASKQIDLKFIDWKKDTVKIRGVEAKN